MQARDQDAPARRPGRRWAGLVAAAVVAAVALLGVRLSPDGGRDGLGTAAERTGAEIGADDLGFNRLLAAGLVIGDVAQLPDGAVARLNGVHTDVTVTQGLPAPEPGMRLVGLDVEVCAGPAERFVDAALWVGLGDDDTVHSAHLGVRDLVTLTLAQGSCQRGGVDLALPDGVALQEVLLADRPGSTVARWAADGGPGELAPLSSGVTPTAEEVGKAADLVTGGFATLHEVVVGTGEASGPGTTRATIDVELCAGAHEFATSPRYWFVQLADHRLITAERQGATMPTATLPPESCARGTADFAVPVGAEVAAVLYASEGVFEDARWRTGP